MNSVWLEKINNTETRRQMLSELRKLCKDKDSFGEVYDFVDECYDQVVGFLSDEDGKTRKNTALLLGELGFEDSLNALWQAYATEEQLFVKSSYLEALLHLDYSELISELHDRVTQLSSMEVPVEHKKHIEEELRILNQLLVQEEGINVHLFKGAHEEHDCILFTNKTYKSFIEAQITDGEILPFASGVRVKTGQLRPLLEIRDVQEILFVIPNLPALSGTAEEIGSQIAKSGLLEMLKKDHKGFPPFYFRIELKTKMTLEQKSSFAKKLASAIEAGSRRQLINSPKDYEFELRLIEGKSGNFHGLIKYMTIPDVRFDYREHFMPNSIKPWQAALLVDLAKDYMVKDAQVLDPFCGVATMLIERQKIVKANTSYGIDISKEAIEKAKQNTANAGQIIHFINKDFFDFTHEYLFDEVFTNMPWALGKTYQSEVEDIYRKFFVKLAYIMKEKNTVILFSHDAPLAKKYAKENGYSFLKEYPIQEKEETCLLIFKK